MKKENDLFTDFLKTLSKKKKKVAFEVVKRYLKLKYRITFSDKVLSDRLLDFKKSVESKENTKDDK